MIAATLFAATGAHRRRWLSALLSLCLSVTVGNVGAMEPVDFTLNALDGGQQKLSDYRGRWVVVNYWATWCPPCLEEIPELEIFHQNNQKEKAVVLGVNSENIPIGQLRGFVEDNFISYPMFHERPRRWTPFGTLTGLPTTYILTPQGIPVAMQAGGITADVLERFIKEYEAGHIEKHEDAPADDARPRIAN